MYTVATSWTIISPHNPETGRARCSTELPTICDVLYPIPGLINYTAWCDLTGDRNCYLMQKGSQTVGLMYNNCSWDSNDAVYMGACDTRNTTSTKVTYIFSHSLKALWEVVSHIGCQLHGRTEDMQ